MKRMLYNVPDYEHRGDLNNAELFLKNTFPKIEILKVCEDIDYEQENEYIREYGELDEHIYQGYIEFNSPEEYIKKLENYGCYEI